MYPTGGVQLCRVRCANGVEVPAYALDAATHAQAVHLHHETLWASTCKRAVINEVLVSPPDFYWRGAPLPMTPAFAALFQERWMPACEAIMDLVWTLGVAPVQLVRDGGDLVPEPVRGTLGRDYHIATYVDAVDRRQRFVYWDMRGDARRGRHAAAVAPFDFLAMGVPLVALADRDNGDPADDGPAVHVLSGFGHDPSDAGALRSVIAAALADHRYMSLMSLFTARGEALRSDPAILTETVPESAGVLRGADAFDYYRDGDRRQRDAQTAFRRNAAELEAVQRQQLGAYGEDALDTALERGRAALSGDIDRPAPLANVFPLPVSHRLAQQVHPPARTDWVDLQRLHQELVASAYGVPRSNLIADNGRSQANALVTQRAMHATVARWRQLLSQAVTYLYRAAYGVHDAAYAEERHLRLMYMAARGAGTPAGGVAEAPDDGTHAPDAAPMTFREQFGVGGGGGGDGDTFAPGAPIVTAHFPTPSTSAAPESQQQLVGMYALGVIDYAMLRRQLLSQSGMSAAASESAAPHKDPWRADEKLGIVRKLYGKSLDALGEAGARIFPVPLTEAEKKAKAKGGAGKKKKSSSSGKKRKKASSSGTKKTKKKAKQAAAAK